jgi:HD-GYP domain-containing protein (c-di-GMP phosphodiesterase class II)
LKSGYGVCSVIVDEIGQAEQLGGKSAEELPVSRYYPINFEEEIGGMRCSAKTEAALDAAEPHILYCIASLREILLKDWILKQTADEMLELSSQLNFLLNLANKVVGIQDLRDYCSIILEAISEAVHADGAMICIQGERSDKDILIDCGFEETGAREFYKNSVIQEAQEGRTVIVSLSDGTSALIAPIKEKEAQAGYMAFFKNRNKRFFTSYEKKFLGVIDNIISPTMESRRLYESLHELYLNTVKSLAAAIDAKDTYTYGHSFRVAKYSISIGKHLNISREKLTHLEIAAYMHDLGKIGVPESILAKPGRLTPQEFEEVKKHPILTDKILEPIELPKYIVDAAVQHHERLNGQGYPFGLKGDCISSFARIIAVADVFDALTSTRHYRNAMTVEDALTILCQGVDTEYDREALLALILALKNEKDDQDLAKLYASLKFRKIDQMRSFLAQLTEFLIVKNPGNVLECCNMASVPEECREVRQLTVPSQKANLQHSPKNARKLCLKTRHAAPNRGI